MCSLFGYASGRGSYCLFVPCGLMCCLVTWRLCGCMQSDQAIPYLVYGRIRKSKKSIQQAVDSNSDPNSVSSSPAAVHTGRPSALLGAIGTCQPSLCRAILAGPLRRHILSTKQEIACMHQFVLSSFVDFGTSVNPNQNSWHLSATYVSRVELLLYQAFRKHRQNHLVTDETW